MQALFLLLLYFEIEMGNDLCSQAKNLCSEDEPGAMIYEYPVTTDPQGTAQRRRSREPTSQLPLAIPELHSEVLAVLAEKSELLMEFTQRQGMLKARLFGEDIYEGELQGKVPHGIGKMYKSDGSLFVGRFLQGRAEGPGLYILPDGAYFQGGMADNKAECEKGRYVNKHLTYEGAFKDNLFSGDGRERSNRHCFEGSYQNGVRRCGELKWWSQPGQQNEHSYYGKFDSDGLFTDEGVLREPTGTYTGTFLKGKKHGEGTYLFLNKIKYQGEYLHGVKQGKGKVSFADKDAVIYEGQFKNGLPDGKGVKYEQDGSKIQAMFRQGINVLTLIDPQSV